MKEAVVLMNMGGPNNLSEVKVFLKNMFNDKYIIGAPKPIRMMIAFMITNLRIKEATSNYEKLGGMSPIIGNTKRLVRKVKKELGLDVFYEMRYTPPFADDVLIELKNYDRIYAIPMYPHYSQTTTKSSIEDFMQKAKKYNLEEKIFTIDSYFDNDTYNKAIVEKIKESLKDSDSEDFDLVFSAHGLTQKVIDNGDLYQKHILANVECVKKELKKQKIEFKDIHVAYQSRVGPMKWLEPYLEDKLEKMTNNKVILYPISFTVDNSETDFELKVEYKELADELGFVDYRVAKVVNNHPLFIKALEEIITNIKNNILES